MVDDDTDWHLDKKVPIGIITTILVQTVLLVVIATAWKSDVDHRIAVLEEVHRLDAPQEARITILEQQTEFSRAALERIEATLERQLDRLERQLTAPLPALRPVK